MGHSTYCVVNFKNTSKNSTCKFYRFPKSDYKQEQRKQWIAAVRTINPDGSQWSPKPSDYICSAHFIGNKNSEEECSPSYVP
ncbi:uncharacterized protein LOC117168302 [Belonocnema kinseyi]|uniref:uncharacterized protein LOC117168302 n=1 Tax=Belonocnema kinseyi TaxID=2817044 RepID=UPI00143DCA52|nr:uncharacterized protein LOC117168302 [Belonocnema kinseyi]